MSEETESTEPTPKPLPTPAPAKPPEYQEPENRTSCPDALRALQAEYPGATHVTHTGGETLDLAELIEQLEANEDDHGEGHWIHDGNRVYWHKMPTVAYTVVPYPLEPADRPFGPVLPPGAE